MENLPIRRQKLRLRDYDYRQPGFYFVTLCVCNRMCLLGEVVDGAVRVSDAGECVEKVWSGLPGHYANVSLDSFVVMPNHVHGIIQLIDVGAGLVTGLKPATTGVTHGLPEIVRAFKTFSARPINSLRRMPCAPVWQRNYYERVIRNEAELLRVREYIASNPLQWALDAENPANVR